jgi:hypothetical protein
MALKSINFNRLFFAQKKERNVLTSKHNIINA